MTIGEVNMNDSFWTTLALICEVIPYGLTPLFPDDIEYTPLA
jgi:hypothetical protein